MDNEGGSIRILCDALCVLNFAGVNYRGVIENISLSGALIKLYGAIPSEINPGDNCALLICSDQEACPIKYVCRVARCDSTQIGVQFMELDSTI
jgi:hypothetical protein